MIKREKNNALRKSGNFGREKSNAFEKIIELVKNEKYEIRELCTVKINISTGHNFFVFGRCSI